ncbi:NAD(P)/FAD-dependent oxidoreductase [Streptomyces solaniscabiei]|uniref:NAD(P)/FAD-dependent oxidoreductase n=1 Tax=Streptomyces solaniscabiei TaxID=2683255 RepID=UPI001CE2F2BC|nr:FAD-dependent monooxygenase [Streptomyces solaniscabiei]
MSEPTPHKPRRAVIIGGSIAGMLAAAAVSDSVDIIDVIDAHEVPSGPEPRAGVPQAAHFHTLLSGGAEAFEGLLPGSTGDLIAAGANRVPVTTDMVMYSPEGWYRRWANSTHFQITASRNLTDSVIRERVLANPKVRVHQQTKAVALLGDKSRISGLRLRSAQGREYEQPAHLIVDASGRASRTPNWLRDLGITSLKEERIDTGLSYASRIYQAPVTTRGWPIINLQADFRGNQPRAGGIIPIERDRWHVSLIGPPGAEPGRDASSFEEFARNLRHPIVADLLSRATPLTEVTFTRTTANRRYFYERLRPWPEGLIVVGDAVAAFNPIYGQGMTVAARSALAIRQALSTRGLVDGIARKAQQAIASPVGLAWTLSAGSDIHHPASKGKAPNPVDRLLQQYVSRLSRTATGSFNVATALTNVLMLQASPQSLVKPSMLVAALLGPRRPQLDGPPLAPAECRVLDSRVPVAPPASGR